MNVAISSVGESLDQSEVEERHAAATVEQVVAGMGVAVEAVHAVQAAEHETEQALAGEVALVLRPSEHLLPCRATDQVAGQHPRGRMRCQHVGHMDERMAAIEVGERLLVVGLERVVQLVDQTLPDLGNHVVGIKPAESLLQQRAEQAGVAEVGFDRLANTGILHLHRDGTFQPCLGIDDNSAVDLADARRGNRNGIPLDEHLVGCRTQLLLDDTGCKLGAHRWRVRLQFGQRERASAPAIRR